MARFKITIDEKVSVWQTVGMIVEADSESALKDGHYELVAYTGFVDDYPETEDFIERDIETIRII